MLLMLFLWIGLAAGSQWSSNSGQYNQRLENQNWPPQEYHFSYSTGQGAPAQIYREERQNLNGNVQGKFGYTDPYGRVREVQYEAGPQGFIASGDTGPDEEALRIARQLQEEDNAFKAPFLRLWNEIAARAPASNDYATSVTPAAKPYLRPSKYQGRNNGWQPQARWRQEINHVTGGKSQKWTKPSSWSSSWSSNQDSGQTSAQWPATRQQSDWQQKQADWQAEQVRIQKQQQSSWQQGQQLWQTEQNNKIKSQIRGSRGGSGQSRYTQRPQFQLRTEWGKGGWNSNSNSNLKNNQKQDWGQKSNYRKTSSGGASVSINHPKAGYSYNYRW